MIGLRWLLFVLFLAVPLPAQESWTLMWGDEFNGPAASAPSPSTWAYDVGGGGWQNNELETYTNSSENSYIDGLGNLAIRAVKDPNLGFTSARLKSQGKFAIAYGKIEARIKLPTGQGIWPAFWMLGGNYPSVAWPLCGEIDIAENSGSQPTVVRGSVHGPGYSGAASLGTSYSLPVGTRFADDFHVFAVVWLPGSVEFLVDGFSYEKVTASSLPAGGKWVFDAPFFLLLNVAVGGDWPGPPDGTTNFPQTMLVDYVRVYRSSNAPIINPGGVVEAASFGTAVAPGSLASVFGSGFSASTDPSLFDATSNHFRYDSAGTSIKVDGRAAPLIFVSPNQINFQIPVETPVGSEVVVAVTRGTVQSNAQAVTFGQTAPSIFSAGGSAIITCLDPSTALGANCTVWGNGFGTTSTGRRDGTPNPPNPLPFAVSRCSLTVGGVPASITYCGAAPGLIIDQLNFVYPPAIPTTPGGVPAVLTIGSSSGTFLAIVPPRFY